MAYNLEFTLITARNVSCSANRRPKQDLGPTPKGVEAYGWICFLSEPSRNHLSGLNDSGSVKYLSSFIATDQCRAIEV